MARLTSTPRRVERETIAFELDDGRLIDVAQVRDPRARRMRLLVNERGVRLTLPPRASAVSGQRFLAENGGWVAIQLARFQAAAALGGEGLEIGRTATLPLRGEKVPVQWSEGRYTRVEAHDAGILVQVPATPKPAALSRALADFYAAQARTDAGRWLPQYLPGLPQAPRGLRFKRLSSLWGSLSPSGEVSLDLSLVLGRPAAFEYVLVHELCHLVERNHSRRFWREVEQRFAGWHGERDYLRAEGSALKLRLERLLTPVA
ncbi:M48 family metallopeptidase [Alkalisalibacterium limincola]|uniref:M48 family metallopeptidase n=1 Tax=Alkalisalibacterium limincola TaxID=2699169 RepID=A0A5C8KRW7_9GAMM|nr:SprT family zinc-dependent metalloprotease [Alkalisalibacterium limincola]TXK62240.1 M48 family metallopeptidase [Alkalisalibacterium limincola]